MAILTKDDQDMRHKHAKKVRASCLQTNVAFVRAFEDEDALIDRVAGGIREANYLLMIYVSAILLGQKEGRHIEA